MRGGLSWLSDVGVTDRRLMPELPSEHPTRTFIIRLVDPEVLNVGLGPRIQGTRIHRLPTGVAGLVLVDPDAAAETGPEALPDRCPGRLVRDRIVELPVDLPVDRRCLHLRDLLA